MLDRHVARMPSTVTTQQEGKYMRIVSVEFVDERPEEYEWAEAVCVEQSDENEYQYFSDDEVPF